MIHLDNKTMTNNQWGRLCGGIPGDKRVTCASTPTRRSTHGVYDSLIKKWNISKHRAVTRLKLTQEVSSVPKNPPHSIRRWNKITKYDPRRSRLCLGTIFSNFASSGGQTSHLSGESPQPLCSYNHGNEEFVIKSNRVVSVCVYIAGIEAMSQRNCRQLGFWFFTHLIDEKRCRCDRKAQRLRRCY